MRPLPASVAERVARESYGRLLAYLAARCRDLEAAEDALGDAFAAALTIWPREGIPAKPEAWLLTVARRKIIDKSRHSRIKAEASERLILAAEELEEAALSASVFPDERLKLMYACAHPAIDAAAQTPLILQTVLGLDAAKIAAAFVVPPATMSQRLVRAKVKIRDAGISFDVPDAEHLAERTQAVLDAVYAAYSLGREEADETGHHNLADEAVWLARVVTQLLPREPEALGLVALILFCESRRGSGRDPVSGAYIPLSDQDPRQWSAALIDEAETLLKKAASIGSPGRYQYEAAIQSVHADRVRTGGTDWPAICTLYEALIALAPTLGALVARAAAVAEKEGPHAGLRLLNEIEVRSISSYQPYWAVLANLCARAQDFERAGDSFDRAIALSNSLAIKTYLIEQKRKFCA